MKKHVASSGTAEAVHGEVIRARPALHEVPVVPVEICRGEPLIATSNSAHYLWMLRRNWWKCLAFVCVAVAAAGFVTARLTTLYESTATIDIDRQMPFGVIGQESVRPGANDTDQFIATQVKVIQSDSVLRKVALQYGLLDGYRQGLTAGNPQEVSRQDTPISLPALKVTRPPNTYLLQVTYRSHDPQLASDVANGISNSYIQHMYDIRFNSSANLSTFMERQLADIRANMEKSGAALTRFERDLNIINPEEKTSILSARLVQLNAEYTAAEGDRVRKEAAYSSVKSGSLEAAQVSTQGEALKKLTDRLDEAQQKFSETKEHFGINHPEYRKASAQVSEVERLLQKAKANIARRVEIEFNQAVNREEMLKTTVAKTKVEFDRLNENSFQYQALKREAETDRKLYEELMRKIKESGINAGFQGSAIRISDPARPGFKPVYPNQSLNLTLTFLLASLLSVVVVVAGDALSNSVRDPEVVAHCLNTEVIGALPRTKVPQLKVISCSNTDPRGRLLLGGWASPESNAFDAAVRSLRNSILLGRSGKGVRSVLITSPAPSEGKSTIAVNLAIANAQQGYRTLLIDGDLRRPAVHTRTNSPAELGLPDVIRSGASWRQVVVKHEHLSKLDMLLGNSPSSGDAELIGEALPGILADAADSYDLIVVDSPPILGFPEPLQMATSVDGVVVVAHAGQTSRKSLSSALSILTRLHVKVLGIALNEVCAATTENHTYYNPYGKYSSHYGSRS